MNDSPLRVSLFFPVYRDEATVERVTRKAVAIMDELASEYEVIIVDDGSPDHAGEVADELARTIPNVHVIHHERNMGYGAALRSGFRAARYEWICFTDGDDEYDVDDLRRLIRLRDYYDLIITFRYAKRYSGVRILISYVYNRLLRLLFQTRYRDISCGLRMIRKTVADELNLQSTSPFVGAEIAIKTTVKGFRVGEVGVQTFPRQFGKGSSTTLPNILATIRDMLHVHRTIFSSEYDPPLNRRRADEPDSERGGHGGAL